MQMLARHGFIEAYPDVFDYGCGQGDDIRILESAGIAAAGWDPHFRPDAERRPADLVNLGFVLNVIENPQERLRVLQDAWSVCRKIMAVAVMVEGRYSVQGLTPFTVPNDGALNDELAGISSSIKSFVADRCELGASYRVLFDDQFNACRQWCIATGVPWNERMRKNYFGAQLRSAFPGMIGVERPRAGSPDNRPRYYVGIRLRSAVAAKVYVAKRCCKSRLISEGNHG